MDISILKYCPHCEAPLPPARFDQCISSDNKCSCCKINPPEQAQKNTIKCGTCEKELTKSDFENNLACVTPTNIICIDCLKAKRIAEREKGVYLCDVCNVELTPLDFFEREAVVSQMLILCSDCKENYPDGIFYQSSQESSKSDDLHDNTEAKPKKEDSGKTENLSSKKKKKHKIKLRNDKKKKDKKNSEKSEKPSKPAENKSETLAVPEIVAENTLPQETTDKSVQPKSSALSVRFQGNTNSAGSNDLKAALGCLVFLVVALCVFIAVILFNFYNTKNEASQKDLLLITNLLTERVKDVSERVDRLNQRLYQLEQNAGNPVINKTSEPENPDTNDENNPDVADDDNEKPEEIEIPEPAREAYENLTSNNSAKRLNAVMDIYRLYFRPAAPILLEIVENDPDKYVRTFAIKTLVAFKEMQLLPLLKKLIFAEPSGIVLEEAQKAIRQLESTPK